MKTTLTCGALYIFSDVLEEHLQGCRVCIGFTAHKEEPRNQVTKVAQFEPPPTWSKSVHGSTSAWDRVRKKWNPEKILPLACHALCNNIACSSYLYQAFFSLFHSCRFSGFGACFVFVPILSVFLYVGCVRLCYLILHWARNTCAREVEAWELETFPQTRFWVRKLSKFLPSAGKAFKVSCRFSLLNDTARLQAE